MKVHRRSIFGEPVTGLVRGKWIFPRLAQDGERDVVSNVSMVCGKCL